MALAHADSRRRRFPDLAIRTLSALVLVALTLACLWSGGGAWAVLVTLAALGAGSEWSAICGFGKDTAPRVVLLVLIATAGIGAALGREEAAIAALLIGATLLALNGWRVKGQGGWLAAAALAIGIATVALIWLRLDRVAGRSGILFLLLVVWASDIGAYFFGRLVGGPKLAPHISPGKTWAGAIGGLALAVAVAILAAVGFQGSASLVTVLVAGALSLASQGGDLCESALKRRFGVKDSGALIPGHGGVLDRLDGMLGAAPTAAILALAWQGAGLWR